MTTGNEHDALSRIKAYLDAGHEIDAIRQAGWSSWIDSLEAKGYDLRTGRLAISPPDIQPADEEPTAPSERMPLDDEDEDNSEEEGERFVPSAPLPQGQKSGSAFASGFLGCLGSLLALGVVGVVGVVLLAWCVSAIDLDGDGSILDDIGGLTDRRITVEVEGTPGLRFSGTCLITSGAGSAATSDIAGSVPVSKVFEGNLISCSFQKQQESGTLRGRIRSGDHVIEESSTSQPYGLVLVAGSP